MAISKVKTNVPGKFKWEVYFLSDGAGSKRVRRRFDSKIDAERFLQNFREEKKRYKLSGLDADVFEKRTFAEEAEYWIENKRAVFTPGTLQRAAGVLKSELLPKYGHIPVMKMNVARVTQIQTDLLKRGKAPLTVNRLVGIIKAILNFSAKHQRIPVHPAYHVQPLKEVKKKMAFWEPAEAQVFLSYAENKYSPGSNRRFVYLVYLLALNTGLRSGEIWGLQAQDLLKERDLIHIRRQYNYVARALTACKGKSDRYVPCHPVVRQELEDWIRQNKRGPEDLLFRGRFNNPIEDHSFKKHHFRCDIEESGVRKIRFHDLRHTAATLMIASGVNLPTVQAILDHKDVSTTMRYVHLLGDSIQQVISSFSVLPTSVSTANLKLLK